MLGNLLDAAVQVADDALKAHYLLAIEPQDHAQHAMGRGMLRAHVDDEFVRIEERLVGRVEVENVWIAHCVLLGPWSLVSRYCPLSIPKLICTHSLSCCRMP